MNSLAGFINPQAYLICPVKLYQGGPSLYTLTNPTSLVNMNSLAGFINPQAYLIIHDKSTHQA